MKLKKLFKNKKPASEKPSAERPGLKTIDESLENISFKKPLMSSGLQIYEDSTSTKIQNEKNLLVNSGQLSKSSGLELNFKSIDGTIENDISSAVNSNANAVTTIINTNTDATSIRRNISILKISKPQRFPRTIPSSPSPLAAAHRDIANVNNQEFVKIGLKLIVSPKKAPSSPSYSNYCLSQINLTNTAMAGAAPGTGTSANIAQLATKATDNLVSTDFKQPTTSGANNSGNRNSHRFSSISTAYKIKRLPAETLETLSATFSEYVGGEDALRYKSLDPCSEAAYLLEPKLYGSRLKRNGQIKQSWGLGIVCSMDEYNESLETVDLMRLDAGSMIKV